MAIKKLKNTFVLLSLGANIGDMKSTLESAIAKLSELKAVANIVKSSYYKTEPYGVKNQDWFLNLCVSGYTNLTPFELLEKCKFIEKHYGRKEREKWQKRELDIDIIFYDNEIIESKELTIPHQEYMMRNFVLIPASEIAGDYIPPLSEYNLSQLASMCDDKSWVKKIN